MASHFKRWLEVSYHYSCCHCRVLLFSVCSTADIELAPKFAACAVTLTSESHQHEGSTN